MRSNLAPLFPGKNTITTETKDPVLSISLWGNLRQRLLGIPPEETTFARRGFQGGNTQIQQRLEQVGQSFLQGYHAALAYDEQKLLALYLNSIEAEWRGFAFEGAAMGLALLDTLTPWRRHRLQQFTAGAGAAHIYMVHVGAGWVLARLPLSVKSYLARLDPLLRWLAIDGYGFHEGYFHWQQSVYKQIVPGKLSGYACRAFDQGLGRSLWFIYGADVTRIGVAVKAFPETRQADLWSGVGLACAYAGGIEASSLRILKQHAGAYLPQVAQGVAFATTARLRAGNPACHTDLACQVLCGISSQEAAEITQTKQENLPTKTIEPAYEIWRQRIQAHFVA